MTHDDPTTYLASTRFFEKNAWACISKEIPPKGEQTGGGVTQPIYILVNDLFFATKIVKSAQAITLEARAFDTADRLLEASRQKEPSLVILDCGGLEKEAFKLLDATRTDEKLSKIPKIGYLSHGARQLEKEMRTAGCNQVYTKSQFTKELDVLIARTLHGVSPRV